MLTVGDAKQEVGRPLKSDELKEGMAVATKKACGHSMPWFSMRVGMVTPSIVELIGAMEGYNLETVELHLILFRRPDGTLMDDSGETIHIHEFLGDV